ncbi:MAG: metal ABC transporter ATP-binding protein [Gammaproteobacteria bacterium]|nr:metal ABC transporter ATP-binding protein [Gammaproteobacteria bacterium]
MNALIEVKHLSVTIGQDWILDNVEMSLDAGEIVTIVGPNGSGKSTLLRALVGAQKISSGYIKRKPGLRVGYVPQRLHLDRSLPMTVGRFLNLPQQQTEQALIIAGQRAGIDPLMDHQLSELSGGQLQRVLLARALLNDPELLILDEATQGLDQQGSADFYRHIEQVRNELNCAVLMVSHELHVVMSATDRVICLNGHVCCHGAPEVVSSRPEYRALFGTGTGGALALYRHDHDHSHSEHHVHDHTDPPPNAESP